MAPRGFIIVNLFMLSVRMVPVVAMKGGMYQSRTMSNDGSYTIFESYDLPNFGCGFDPNPKQNDDRMLSLRAGEYGLELLQMRCPRVTYRGYGNANVKAKYGSDGKIVEEVEFSDPLKAISSDAHTLQLGKTCSRVADILTQYSVPGVSNVGDNQFDALHNKICVLYERAARQAMGQDVTPHLQS